MKLDKTTLAIGGVGLIALIAIMRSGGGSNAAGLAATASSIANASAIGVQYSQIGAQRDAQASDAATARLSIVADVFKATTANANSISIQAMANQANTAQAAMLTGAQVTDSYISSDLAQALGADQLQTSLADIAGQNTRAQIDSATQVQLGQYAKTAANTADKYNLLTNMSHDAQKTITSIYGHPT